MIFLTYKLKEVLFRASQNNSYYFFFIIFLTAWLHLEQNQWSCYVEIPFSLIIDESEDKNTDKWLVVVVGVFEDGMGPRTKLPDMPVCSGGTIETIFIDIDALLATLNIPQIYWIGFC